MMKLIDCISYKNDLKKALSKIDLSTLKDKTIFITGGLGLICSSICDILLEYGGLKKIIIADRDIKRFEEKYGGLSGIEYFDYDAIAALQLPFSPDFIICGAGLASPDLYTKMPVETVLSNVNGVYHLLEFSKNNAVERLLYISSSEVYGTKENNDPFKEGAYGKINIDDVRSSYPMAKRLSEMLCRAYASEYNINTVIVRPGHIYGPTASIYDKRISSAFAYKAAQGQDLIMKSSGTQKRSYCYSVDCAVQILYVLIKGQSSKAYNIGHDSVITIAEMAKIYAKAGNVNLFNETASDEEKSFSNPMDNSSLDNNEVKKLGYSDSFSVEEGLERTVSIIKEMLNN